jgi:chemotaxis protein MotB
MSAGRGGRRKKQHHEEHPDERWLVTFADMMVLLVAVFIVLFAISSVNTSKAEALRESIDSALSGKILPGGDAIKETGGDNSTDGLRSSPPNPSLAAAMAKGEEGKDAKEAAAREERDLQRLKEQVEAYAAEHGLSKQISATVDKDGLNIRLRTDDLLFDSGSAVLKPASAPILTKIGGLLRTDNHPIQVEGHTDAVPARGSAYPTNWELSTARSSAVVRALMRRMVAAARLTATGRANLDPLATNATAEGRAENRRVEIVLPRRQAVTGTESTTP